MINKISIDQLNYQECYKALPYYKQLKYNQILENIKNDKESYNVSIDMPSIGYGKKDDVCIMWYQIIDDKIIIKGSECF